MVRVAGAYLDRFAPYRARELFYRPTVHLADYVDRLRRESSALVRDRTLHDIAPGFPGNLQSPARLADAEYFISIRHGILPLRIGGDIFLEVYSPHRCAHQFGYDQGIPALCPCPSFIAPSLLDLRRLWSYLFRFGTGAQFTIPRLSRLGLIHPIYVNWYTRLSAGMRAWSPGDFARVCAAPHLQQRAAGLVIEDEVYSEEQRYSVAPPDFGGRDTRFTGILPSRRPLVAPVERPLAG